MCVPSNEYVMFRLSASKLAEKPALHRYLYFLFSSFQLTSFRAWRRAGEPNPFVGKTYRQHVTERVEFVDIFGDDLATQRSRSRQR